jgi:serine beta-lactamase-like protein LACTB, mitochondrial
MRPHLTRFFFAGAVLAAACAPAAAPPHPPQAERSDSLAQALVTRFGLPGLSVAVARADGTSWRWQVGFANLATGRRVNRLTVFRVGSISKLYTAAITARLSARGKLDLDAPVTKYLPNLPAHYAGVTPRLLAGHLAGVRHYGAGEFENVTRYAGVPAALGIFINDTLLTRPGTRYFYSTYGYNLLGAVLEAASGRTFAQLLAEEVGRPLGLVRTVLEPYGGSGPDQATPYSRDREGKPVLARKVDLSDRWPAGGLIAPAEEVARFGLGMFRPGFLPGTVRETVLTSQRTAGGVATRVGLGWRIASDSMGRRYAHHGGASTGGRAFILVYPDQGVAVALLSNTEANFGEAEALAFARLALPCERVTDPPCPDR